MKINVKETVSRVVNVDNSADDERVFDIEAQVTIERENVSAVREIKVKEGGRIFADARTESNAHPASAVSAVTSSIIGSFFGTDEHPNSEIISAIEEFVNDVKQFNFDE